MQNLENLELDRGLTVAVYRTAKYGDCTLNGVSSYSDELTIVGVVDRTRHGGNHIEALPQMSRVFAVSEKAPAAVVIVRTDFGGNGKIYSVEPLDQVLAGEHGMMGGNYAACSDSRWRALIGGMYGAVAIHDRVER